MFLSLAMPLAVPAISYAAEATAADTTKAPKPNIQQGLCAGSDLTLTDTCSKGMSDAEAQKKINDLIKSFINLLSSFVGIVAVIMVMFGGFKYITSGGNDSNVSGAKNTILYAIIGIVVVAFAQYLVKYVLSQVTTK